MKVGVPGFPWMKFYSPNFPKVQLLFLFKELTLSFSLVQEANEAGALRIAKTKLEKQLEDLTWRLQLEKKLRVLVHLLTYM